MATLSPGSDNRLRSFSIATPTEVQRLTVGGAPPARRMSTGRALDVKFQKSETPLWKWIQDHVDKQLIGLSINFLILIVLLMLLKVFVQWIQLAQMALKTAASAGEMGAAGGRS